MSPIVIPKMMKRKITSPGGKPTWYQGTVESILTNEKYKGDALLQKYYTKDYLTHKQVRNTGEIPQYYVEDHHEAIIDADVVMGLRIQLERQKKGLFPSVREYFRFFGVDESRLKLAKPDAILMHPGPVNRGVELSTSVIDGDKSVITEQVTNGVAVRMAVMDMVTRGGF